VFTARQKKKIKKDFYSSAKNSIEKTIMEELPVNEGNNK
jgi:hypothetical protein